MNEFVDIDVGIPQGSLVSPILFLIYISQLFKQNDKFKGCLLLSYLDDIALAVSSSTIQQNSHILTAMATRLIRWGSEHHIQFDIKKTELIHFTSSGKALNSSITLNNLLIKPKETVR
jgi:hypothetical protein